MPGDERDDIGSPNDGRGQAKPTRLICPCCGSGTPDCTMPGHTHAETCATYRYFADVCATCRARGVA